jgi:Arc/MetJ-type ribon-helix-helix transcriptional regulator
VKNRDTVTVRLPAPVKSAIENLVGTRGVSEFIRQAIAEKLKRARG